jgi:hypothetical protein
MSERCLNDKHRQDVNRKCGLDDASSIALIIKGPFHTLHPPKIENQLLRECVSVCVCVYITRIEFRLEWRSG